MIGYYTYSLCTVIMQGSEDIFLEGLEQIASYIRHSTDTVRRWHRKHDFPLIRLSNGKYATTQSLIDDWLLARNRAERGLA